MDAAPQLVQMIQNEEQIGKMVRQYFLRIREDAKNDKKKDRTLTAEILDTLNFVNNNIAQPVQVLKSLGLILFKNAISFNFSLFSSRIICCKAILLQKLSKEGWKNVNGVYDKKVAALVGVNEVKNWSTFEYPTNSELGPFISTNEILIANESCFGLDHNPSFILIGPGMPPEDVLIEPHFPLVSIQYERTHETQVILNYIPSQNPIAKKSWNITPIKQINIPYV